MYTLLFLLVQNIEFMPTILSRFDMIFIVKDEHNVARDMVSIKPLITLIFFYSSLSPPHLLFPPLPSLSPYLPHPFFPSLLSSILPIPFFVLPPHFSAWPSM